MDIIADILLGLGAIAATIYCMILSKRLRRFNNLENGMGGAVAVLSAQVDDMTKTLEKAQKSAGHSAAILSDLTDRAEESSQKLELMMASLHDLPESPPIKTQDTPGTQSSTIEPEPPKSTQRETATPEPEPEPSHRENPVEVAPEVAYEETPTAPPPERAPIFSSKRMTEAAE